MGITTPTDIQHAIPQAGEQASLPALSKPVPDQPYRPIGIRLASLVQSRSKQGLQTNTLQALVADLAGEQAELIMPLRDLVSRPGFRALIPLACSGKGQLQRDALIDEMGRTFAPPVIAAIRDVLDGFLEVSGSASPGTQRAAADPWDIPETVVMPGMDPQESSAPSSAPAAHAASASEPAPASGLSIAQLAGIAALCTALAAGGFAVLRSTVVCEPLGWCKADTKGKAASTEPSAGLKRAQDAARSMENADSLAAHETSLLELERALTELEDERLSEENGKERDRLQAEAQAGRRLLNEEQAHRNQVQQAARLLQDPSQADQAKLTATTAALEAIPARSFAAEEAGRIKADLARLQPRLESASTADRAPASQPREQERPPIRAQIPYTAPPAPRPQPARPAAPNQGSPYRDEPLW